MRLCITGGPKTGKTTLALKLANPGAEGPLDPSLPSQIPLIHGDDYLSLGWSESTDHLAVLLQMSEPWIMEGVQIPRAIRKALKNDPDTKPCDKLILLVTRRDGEHPKQGQESMRKGIQTVLAEILPDLERLGVIVQGEQS